MRLRRSLEEAAEDMERTLGYMRAFVTHIGITASQVVSSDFDFVSFTDDVATCVKHGGSQVSILRVGGNALGCELEKAVSRSRDLAQQCQSLLPEIARGLGESVNTVCEYRTRIAAAAEQVSDVAKDFRTRIGRILASLQVGDSVRQRIQHVGGGLAWLQQREEASSAASDRSHYAAAQGLLADLLAATAAEFEREVEAIESSMSALVSDIGKVGAMQRLLGGDASEKEGGLGQLQLLLNRAVALVREIEAADQLARDALSAATAAARRLMPSIEAVKVMKEDVRFMAINTALRSLRVGELGKPLRVVALELSSHSDHLDGFAKTCLEALEQLIGLADSLSRVTAADGEPGGDAARLTAGQILATVATQVRGANNQSRSLNQALGSDIDALLVLLAKPDRLVGLRDGVSPKLAAALPVLGCVEPSESALTVDGASTMQAFLAALAASYSMEQERAIQGRFVQAWSLDECDRADILESA